MKEGQAVRIIRGPYQNIQGHISEINANNTVKITGDFTNNGGRTTYCFHNEDFRAIYPTQEDAEFAVSLVNYVNSVSGANLSKTSVDLLGRLDGEKRAFFEYCFGEFSPWKTVLKSKKTWQVKLIWDSDKANELSI